MTEHLKMVEFESWCGKCKHADASESDDPCWDCLDNPSNWGSHKPLYFEPAEVASNSRTVVRGH